MNKIFKFLSFFSLVLILGSCENAVDTAPEGKILTENQKKEVAEKLPERLAADLNGMYAIMGKTYCCRPESERDDDFGIMSVTISEDSNGSDFVSNNNPYNWFTPSVTYDDRTANYANPYIRWAIFYKQIKLANDILLSIPADTKNKELLYYKGQALAVRAFDYLNLVQNYQFTYKGNEDKLTVPLVIEIPNEDPSNNPRAAASIIYTQIISDLDAAIALLEGYDRPSKAFVNQSVAYGLRARTHLLMGNYTKAKEDAQEAQKGSGFASKDDVAKPAFCQASEPSWLWAVVLQPNNIKNEYCNWPSKICSFTSNGYSTGVGCYKMINSNLYQLIPNTDVRKGWWVDQNLKSPLINDKRWPGYPDAEIGSLNIPDIKMPYLPYTNVKFGIKGGIGNGENASDWCLMRNEEMLLIEAEATLMENNNVGTAKNILESWIKTNRDPNYACNYNDSESLLNEIWFQRRVELWGEGFSFKDILRLKKPVVRFTPDFKGNWPEAFRFNLTQDDGYLLMRIPTSEINGNNGINTNDNNSDGSLPQSGQNPNLRDGVIDRLYDMPK